MRMIAAGSRLVFRIGNGMGRIGSRIFLAGRVVFFGCIVAMRDSMLDMLALDPARLAEEGQEDQAPAVEATAPAQKAKVPSSVPLA